MDRSEAARLWRRAQRGWPERYPVVQFPNAPLIVALAASGARRLLDGDAAHAARAVSTAGLLIWAYEELARGDNAFRRALGAGAIIVLIAGIARAYR